MKCISREEGIQLL
jgi:hypothetical protein